MFQNAKIAEAAGDQAYRDMIAQGSTVTQALRELNRVEAEKLAELGAWVLENVGLD